MQQQNYYCYATNTVGKKCCDQKEMNYVCFPASTTPVCFSDPSSLTRLGSSCSAMNNSSSQGLAPGVTRSIGSMNERVFMNVTRRIGTTRPNLHSWPLTYMRSVIGRLRGGGEG